MPKVFSRVRKLRMLLAAKRGRTVTVGEAAEGIGITRVALSRLENDQTEQVSFETMAKIIAFYSRELGDGETPAPITAADVLGFDPNAMRAFELQVA